MAPMRTRGFTLVELMVTVAVIAILLAAAAPAFGDMLGRRRLEGAITELRTDLQLARSEALRRNRTATLTINGTGSGYTITYPDTGGTAIAAKTVQLPSGVTLPANTSVAFTAFRGLFSETDSTARTFTGSSASTTGQLKIDVDAMGRVSVCSPDGSFGGYTTC